MAVSGDVCPDALKYKVPSCLVFMKLYTAAPKSVQKKFPSSWLQDSIDFFRNDLARLFPASVVADIADITDLSRSQVVSHARAPSPYSSPPSSTSHDPFSSQLSFPRTDSSLPVSLSPSTSVISNTFHLGYKFIKSALFSTYPSNSSSSPSPTRSLSRFRTTSTHPTGESVADYFSGQIPRFIFPVYQRIFQAVKQNGSRSPLTCDVPLCWKFSAKYDSLNFPIFSKIMKTQADKLALFCQSIGLFPAATVLLPKNLRQNNVRQVLERAVWKVLYLECSHLLQGSAVQKILSEMAQLLEKPMFQAKLLVMVSGSRKELARLMDLDDKFALLFASTSIDFV
eukprot:TRINITY_DN12597_c0_g1_i1.p1 TRINITY_DN12597_c0_g1~~TRINITY_DN12597_c0_g1_i1.p1  ORF type:complete len:396 (-),score=56.37 TRINITY_DN12597_c0_g1_i1:564-1583(-)